MAKTYFSVWAETKEPVGSSYSPVKIAELEELTRSHQGPFPCITKRKHKPLAAPAQILKGAVMSSYRGILISVF